MVLSMVINTFIYALMYHSGNNTQQVPIKTLNTTSMIQTHVMSNHIISP
jgi:hypothetical protein